MRVGAMTRRRACASSEAARRSALAASRRPADQRVAVRVRARWRQGRARASPGAILPPSMIRSSRPRRPRSRRGRTRRAGTCRASRRSRRRAARSPPARSPRRCRRSTAVGGVDVELAAGEVVEEEQRLGALHQDVVDAHRDQVDADGVVPVEREGELELGADAVGAGDQDRLAVALAAPRTARRSRRCRPAPRGAWCAWRAA